VLRERLGLHERSARDFLDALVALGMLKRESGEYANTPATDLFLDRRKPTYLGGILQTVIDIGCAEGCVPYRSRSPTSTSAGEASTCRRQAPSSTSTSRRPGLGERLRFYPGDFFADELPRADVLIMGHPARLEPGREAAAAREGA
jgi:hypothetical protein